MDASVQSRAKTARTEEAGTILPHLYVPTDCPDSVHKEKYGSNNNKHTRNNNPTWAWSSQCCCQRIHHTEPVYDQNAGCQCQNICKTAPEELVQTCTTLQKHMPRSHPFRTFKSTKYYIRVPPPNNIEEKYAVGNRQSRTTSVGATAGPPSSETEVRPMGSFSSILLQYIEEGIEHRKHQSRSRKRLRPCQVTEYHSQVHIPNNHTFPPQKVSHWSSPFRIQPPRRTDQVMGLLSSFAQATYELCPASDANQLRWSPLRWS